MDKKSMLQTLRKQCGSKFVSKQGDLNKVQEIKKDNHKKKVESTVK